MLKSAAEAEEIVQDVWIRWQTTDRSTVEDPAAFLSTTTRRLAINVIQSARSRYETSGLPSPREPADTSGDPELETERREALQSALRVLLERLSPAERSAYVLREAFDYSYREIAKILRLEEANSRQLVSRARRHVADGRHGTVNSAEQQRFLAAFLAAAHEGALSALESFFVGVAHGSVGRPSRQHRLDRLSPKALRYPALANRWTLPPQRDVKVAESCSGGDLAPWSTLTRNPLLDDELLECIQIAVGE
jgi:RNA polymerase sigma factor (sigma-70 family)